MQYQAQANVSLPQQWINTYYATVSPNVAELHGRVSQRQIVSTADYGTDWHTGGAIAHSATTQQAATADALVTVANIWYTALINATADAGHGAPLSDQSDDLHFLTGESYQPFADAVCEVDYIHGASDTRPVVFPLLYNANHASAADTTMTLYNGYKIPAITYPNLSREALLNISGDSARYRLRWVDLPQNLFNGSSIGAIVFVPNEWIEASGAAYAPYTNDSQTIFICNVAAGWGKTLLSFQIRDYDTVTSTISSNGRVRGSGHVGAPVQTENDNDIIAFKYPEYPQRSINITRQWAQFLDPVVRSANRTVFDMIMQYQTVYPGVLGTGIASDTLVNMIVNGLARTAFSSTVQGTIRTKDSSDGTPWVDINYWLSDKGDVFEANSTQSQDWVKLHMKSTIQGYAYNIHTIPPRLAIAVLSIYCIMAVAHLLYAGVSGT